MASKWPPVKNSAYKFRAPLFARADNQIKTSPTIAAGDFTVSTDGGAFGNLTTLPSQEQTGMIEIDLSASEMNGDEIVVKAVDAAGDEWHSVMWTIHTVAQTLDSIDTNVDSILVDTAEIGAAGAGLDAVPWNATWDAEVQSEVTDALNAYDGPTKAELDSGLAALNDPTVAAIADGVWDEVINGLAHNDPNSAGQRLRQLASVIVWEGVAQAGTTNTITLDTGASAADGAYDPTEIAIVDGTGAGQSRLIFEYNGATKVATVDRDWKVIPDATSEFIIQAHPGREHVNEGLATGGSASTITLNALASSADDAYNNQLVFVRSGTGGDQVRLITDYDGTTKVATVGRNWDVNPDATSGYAILPHHDHEPGDYLDESLAIHTIAGTLGKAVADIEADATAILADTNEIQVDLANGGRLDLIFDAILADTNELQADDVPGLISALENISAADVNAQVDAAFTTQMTDSVPADGTIPTREQAIYMITQFLLERVVVGTTVTVNKVDGSTALLTLTLNDGTSPTSITRST